MTKRSASDVLESPRTNGPGLFPTDDRYPFGEFTNNKAEESNPSLAQRHTSDFERHSFLQEIVKCHDQLKLLVEKVSVFRFLNIIIKNHRHNLFAQYLF